jgi:hypothetical protein
MADEREISEDEETLVPVWRTTESTVVPHVLAALDQAGIEYMVQDRGIATELMGQRSSMTVGETAPPLVVLVHQSDESRAREIVTTLMSPAMGGAVAVAAEEPPPVAVAPPPSSVLPSAGPDDVVLLDATTGAVVGRITTSQLEELTRHLELESVNDTDLFINKPTIEMLQAAGVSPSTVQMLSTALGTRDGFDVQWVRGMRAEGK